MNDENTIKPFEQNLPGISGQSASLATIPSLPTHLFKLFHDLEYAKSFAKQQELSFLALQLRTIREFQGLSQADVATRMGTSQSAVSRMENVEYGRLGRESAQQYCDALGLPLMYCVGDWGEVLHRAHLIEQSGRAAFLRSKFEYSPLMFPHYPPPPGDSAPTIRSIQLTLYDWITLDDGSPEKFRQFLSGLHIAGNPDEAEPCEWLSRAIAKWQMGHEASAHLTKRIAKLIELIPPRIASSAQEALDVDSTISLLRFLCLLPNPATYWQPLLSLLKSIHSPEECPEQIRAILTLAIIANQQDSSLLNRWQKMAADGGDSILLAARSQVKDALKVATRLKAEELRDSPTQLFVNIAIRVRSYELEGRPAADIELHLSDGISAALLESKLDSAVFFRVLLLTLYRQNVSRNSSYGFLTKKILDSQTSVQQVIDVAPITQEEDQQVFPILEPILQLANI